MGITADTLNSLVSITQFNKGQASKIFDRLRTERRLVVLKNNIPAAVILSPEEYVRLSQAVEDAPFLHVAEAKPAWSRREDGAAHPAALAEAGQVKEMKNDAEENTGKDAARLDSYTLGKQYFGKYSSGETDLSVTYKERIRKALDEKYKHHRAD
ncbi:MAG: type II toxin-antitoxin system Phd/YefM family antitoxin [Acidobacteriota bacterium]|jgi:PHD/YefM family antitoxin component YafN of YafNO toxin-antitoxin module|nr:type II toxin-antitoxin system Phd/YefM family antitoxin [Acidobacteriota bacterium]